jgi:DNA transformation protein
MAFKEFLEELYEPMGGVKVRAMFGGLGIFKDALIFGIVFDDALYLRADDDTVGRFAAESAQQFVYRGMNDREVAMPYYRLPERLYDDPEEFIVWSTAAFGVARRAAAEKAQRKRPARSTARPRGSSAKRPAKRPVRKAR